MEKMFVIVAAVAVATLGAQAGGASAASSGSAQVTTASDSGPGSFRAAIELASADPSIGRVVFVGRLDPIALAAPVVYTGSQSLGIVGNGAVLDGDGFRAETGGDLSVIGLTIRDAPDEGLTYEVPESATGTKQVSLNGVSVIGNNGHGVLIDDQANPDDTSNPNGSDASLDVSVINAVFAGNGFGALDRDGLRVNEGGAGSLKIVVRNTDATANGADGIELDERGVGDAVFTVSGTRITENGSFDLTEADLDDGMDVDESGDGALVGRVFNSAANDNLEEGWDLNENDAGDFLVDMTNVQANRNLEEGVDFEEDDDFAGGGDLITTLVNVTADGNAGGDGGLKIREKGDGGLDADIRNAQASSNETDGVNVREDAAGDLTVSVDKAITLGNEGDGVEFEENGTGNLIAAIERSTNDGNAQDGVEFDENGDGDLAGVISRGSASDNGAYGARADQQLPGAGTLGLRAVALDGNVLGGYLAVNVAVTQAL